MDLCKLEHNHSIAMKTDVWPKFSFQLSGLFCQEDPILLERLPRDKVTIHEMIRRKPPPGSLPYSFQRVARDLCLQASIDRASHPRPLLTLHARSTG